jgi:hypothetical protein
MKMEGSPSTVNTAKGISSLNGKTKSNVTHANRELYKNGPGRRPEGWANIYSYSPFEGKLQA